MFQAVQTKILLQELCHCTENVYISDVVAIFETTIEATSSTHSVNMKFKNFFN